MIYGSLLTTLEDLFMQHNSREKQEVALAVLVWDFYYCALFKIILMRDYSFISLLEDLN